MPFGLSAALMCSSVYAAGNASAGAGSGDRGAAASAHQSDHGKIQIRQGEAHDGSGEHSPQSQGANAGAPEAHHKIHIGDNAAGHGVSPDHGRIHIDAKPVPSAVPSAGEVPVSRELTKVDTPSLNDAAAEVSGAAVTAASASLTGNLPAKPSLADDTWISSAFRPPQMPDTMEPLSAAQKQAASYKAKGAAYLQTLYAQATDLKETAGQTLSRLQEAAGSYRQQAESYTAQGVAAVDNAKAMGQAYMAQGMAAVDNAKAMGQAYTAQGMAAVDNAKATGQGYMAQGAAAADNAKASGQGYMAQGMAAADTAKEQVTSAADGAAVPPVPASPRPEMPDITNPLGDIRTDLSPGQQF